MQKQVEKARRRKEEVTHRQNQLFEVFMQRFSVPQDENRASAAIEQVGPEVREQSP